MSSNSTRDKLHEAKHFCKKMVDDFQDDDLFRHNFSAFLSASRSVTSHMQKQYSDVEGFSNWYSSKQEEMKVDSELPTLNKMRIEELKKERLPSENTRVGRFAMTAVLVKEGQPIPKQPEPPKPTTESNQSETVLRSVSVNGVKVEVVPFAKSVVGKLTDLVDECERRFLPNPLT